MSAVRNSARQARAQLGFTLIELLVSMLIGLFLLGGLGILVQDNRRTFSSQNALSQLQDSQRLAMSMITDVVQASGYFPNPTLNTAASTMLALGTMTAGQAMTGTYNAATPGDTITARYATTGGDGILNCAGTSNPVGGGVTTYVNTFSVAVNAAGVSQLVCNLGIGLAAPTAYPLVSGITNMTILYGVNTSGAGNNADTYMNATQVTANADWNNVISVKITLQFLNPLWQATAQGQGTQPHYINFQRVISVLNQTGV